VTILAALIAVAGIAEDHARSTNKPVPAEAVVLRDADQVGAASSLPGTRKRAAPPQSVDLVPWRQSLKEVQERHHA
jgi:hypothetical protein